MRRTLIYWIAQVLGWGAFVMGNLAGAILSGEINLEAVVTGLCMFVFGITVSHVFRAFVKYRGWTDLPLLKIVPRVLISALLQGLFLFLLVGAVSDLFLPEAAPMLRIGSLEFVPLSVNFASLFFVWNLIYFSIHLVENYRKSQINNLELEAAKTEAELNSFKSQLNPHFLFNSLNSIRALVDEDPEKAKSAITTLSGIMRNFLSSGRMSLISLKEEMDLVEKYLTMEKIRFEERLDLNIDIESAVMDTQVPPLMIQTLVENGIKHGISKLKAGGSLSISGKAVGSTCQIIIRNSGQLKSNQNGGIGLANTHKRLDLIFEGDASFALQQQNDDVVATLIIPHKIKKLAHESIDR